MASMASMGPQHAKAPGTARQTDFLSSPARRLCVCVCVLFFSFFEPRRVFFLLFFLAREFFFRLTRKSSLSAGSWTRKLSRE